MFEQPTAPADVFSAREIARAAGVPQRVVARLIGSGEVATIDGRFVGTRDAVRAVRRLRAGQLTGADAEPALFARAPGRRRPAAGPLAASGLVHAAGFALILFLAAWGADRPDAVRETSAKVPPVRLVYLNLPGPGGGGGGGGRRQPTPPPAARLKGPAQTPSPVAIRLPRPASQSIPPARPSPPRPIEAAPRPGEARPALLPNNALPPVVAPVVSLASDRQTLAGLLDSPTEEPSQGPGSGGGVGSGEGTGLGEGTGPGIGPGSGGGTGGGPYRPGSGIEPPRLLREVHPRYTEEARRRTVEGEVVVEIVVRSDGRVGDVRILQRLGSGLDDRAVDAVRQWVFEPARRLGVPVDVLVEVAVEFKLR